VEEEAPVEVVVAGAHEVVREEVVAEVVEALAGSSFEDTARDELWFKSFLFC